MIRSSWAAAAAFIVVLCGIVGIPGGAEAQASFDCRRATHPSEITICRDSGLASADRRLDAVFRSALERSASPDALRAEQRIWLSDLRGCGEDTFCLAETYADRIEALEADPKATEPNPVVKDAATDESSPDTTSTIGVPLAEEPTDVVEAASAEARIEPATEANSDDGSGDAAVVERPHQRRPARTDGIVGMIGGGPQWQPCRLDPA